MKMWFSWERKELFKWNKKHFPGFQVYFFRLEKQTRKLEKNIFEEKYSIGRSSSQKSLSSVSVHSML